MTETAPTPAEATATLSELSADHAWTAKLLVGNGPEVAQFKQLMEAKSATVKGERLDQIIAGTAPTGPETLSDGQLSAKDQMTTAADLKNIGVSESAIRELFEGRQVDKKTFDLAEQYRAERLGDPEWVKRYLGGGRVERREMALLAIIRVGGVKDERTAA